MDASILVSEAEARLFADLAPEARGRIHGVNNGVDIDFFSPERRYDNPYPPGVLPLVFTGAMDYWPNVDAVEFFARDVLPKVRARLPNAKFWIVGSNPAEAVLALGKADGVVVTGRVPDIRPYLAHAAAVVAPLRIARGIQNKVLEAMSMAKPVVASPAAAEGIPAADGREFLVASDPDEFANKLTSLAEQSAHSSLGAAARAYILATYDWQKSLYKLDRILDLMPAGEAAGGLSSQPHPRRQIEGTRR
jgi:sugar transferase (PEP-CTERM/EpsH1 system associated)